MAATDSTDPHAVARLTAVIIAELHRQAQVSGCATGDNGRLVEVDGSFNAQELARAILAA